MPQANFTGLAMSMTLIKNGLVLPLDEAAGPFDRSYPADVLIDGTRISAIKPNLNAPDADVIDAADCLVKFKSNRYFGWILVAGLFADLLLAR